MTSQPQPLVTFGLTGRVHQSQPVLQTAPGVAWRPGGDLDQQLGIAGEPHLVDHGAEQADVVDRQFAVGHLAGHHRRGSQGVGETDLVACRADRHPGLIGQPCFHRRRPRGSPHLGLLGGMHDPGDLSLQPGRHTPQIDHQHRHLSSRQHAQIGRSTLRQRHLHSSDEFPGHEPSAIDTNTRSQPQPKEI